MEEKRINLVEQNKRAFNFIEELYVESSFLIKEIKYYLLNNKDYKFVIGKPRGYQITAPSSLGLNSVELWSLKGFSNFFVEEKFVKKGKDKATTTTALKKGLKVIYIKIIFYDKDNNIEEPIIYSGVLYGFEEPDKSKKFENFIARIDKNWNKYIKDIQENDGYKYQNINEKGKFIKNKLFDINNSEEINDKIIKPLLELYKKNK